MVKDASQQLISRDERRRYRRLAVDLIVLYRSKQQTLETVVANLSQGGLFLPTPRHDTLGTAARVELEIPGEDRRFTLTGEVAWCHPKGSGLGLRFAQLEANTRLALANFLLRLAQNSPA